MKSAQVSNLADITARFFEDQFCWRVLNGINFFVQEVHLPSHNIECIRYLVAGTPDTAQDLDWL